MAAQVATFEQVGFDEFAFSLDKITWVGFQREQPARCCFVSKNRCRRSLPAFHFVQWFDEDLLRHKLQSSKIKSCSPPLNCVIASFVASKFEIKVASEFGSNLPANLNPKWPANSLATHPKAKHARLGVWWPGSQGSSLTPSPLRTGLATFTASGSSPSNLEPNPSVIPTVTPEVQQRQILQGIRSTQLLWNHVMNLHRITLSKR